MKKDKRYKIAFSGNKAAWFKDVKQLVLDEGITQVFEPFGGSGVLSVNLKANGYIDKAYINDYDNYLARLPEVLEIRERTRDYLHARGVFPNSKDYKNISARDVSIIQECIAGYSDFERAAVATAHVYSSKLYRGRLRIEDFNMYRNEHNIEGTRDYIEALKGCTLDCLDWREYIGKYMHEIEGGERTLVILDPPYLNSVQKQYGALWFGVRETCEVMQIMRRALGNVLFMFFNQKPHDVEALLNLTGIQERARVLSRRAIVGHAKLVHGGGLKIQERDDAAAIVYGRAYTPPANT